MIKKITLPILIIAMVIQIIVPIGLVLYGQKTQDIILANGVQYEMDVELNGIYENTVSFSPDYWIMRSLNKGWDVVLEEGENGRMIKGLGDPYKNYKGEEPYIDATRTNIKVLSEYEIDYEGEPIFPYESAYITFVLYKGDAVVTELYINGVSAEEFVMTYDTSIFDEEIDFDEEIIWEEENLFG